MAITPAGKVVSEKAESKISQFRWDLQKKETFDGPK